MRVSSRVAIATMAALLGASLFTGTGSAQLPVATPLLPSLTVDMLLDLANVEAPPQGVGLQVNALFPEENPLLLDGLEIYSFTANITPEGDVVLVSAQNAETASAGSESTAECSDNAFAPTGVKWSGDDMPILWRMDRRSTPAELKDKATLLEVRSGHRVWPQAKSPCTEDDSVSFAYNYLGHTSKNPKYDKVNVVDFGSLGSGALAVNYTWYSGTRIVEVDLRLNKDDYTWTNVAGVKRYQVKNVVAHELGHQFGLDDLGDGHGALTMFARIGKGERNKVSLGRGDLRGAETLSP